MAQSDLTRIASNIAGLNALNALKDINTKLGIHQLRLATGKRINQAADDPAGLTIGIKFNARSRGLGVAIDNIGDAKNLLAVAEGGLSKINDIALLIRDKVAQAASDSLGDDERTAIAGQIKSLLKEINTIATETQWNKRKLLTGEIAGDKALVFQTGSEAGEVTKFGLPTDHRAKGLGISMDTEAVNAGMNSIAKSGDPTQVLAAGNYWVEVSALGDMDGDGNTDYSAVVKGEDGTIKSGIATSFSVDTVNQRITVTLGDATNNIALTLNGIPEVGGKAIAGAFRVVDATTVEGAVTGNIATTDGIKFTASQEVEDPSDILGEGTYFIKVSESEGSYSTAIFGPNGQIAQGNTLEVSSDGTKVTIWDAAKKAKIEVTLDSAPASGATKLAAIQIKPDENSCSVASAINAKAYLVAIDNAIKTVSESMTSIGALVSRLTAKEETLTIAKTNTEAAYNRIMNADMATEQLEAMKLSILQQTATAMLAQANVAPQAVLSLFR